MKGVSRPRDLEDRLEASLKPKRKRSKPRYTTATHWARTGYDWAVFDEHTGLVVRQGWCAGPRRDALAEARLAISELS